MTPACNGRSSKGGKIWQERRLTPSTAALGRNEQNQLNASPNGRAKGDENVPSIGSQKSERARKWWVPAFDSHVCVSSMSKGHDDTLKTSNFK